MPYAHDKSVYDLVEFVDVIVVFWWLRLPNQIFVVCILLQIQRVRNVTTGQDRFVLL